MNPHDFLLRLFLLAAGSFCAVVFVCLVGVDKIFSESEAQVSVPDMRVPVLYGGWEFPRRVSALRCGQ